MRGTLIVSDPWELAGAIKDGILKGAADPVLATRLRLTLDEPVTILGEEVVAADVTVRHQGGSFTGATDGVAVNAVLLRADGTAGPSAVGSISFD